MFNQRVTFQDWTTEVQEQDLKLVTKAYNFSKRCRKDEQVHFFISSLSFEGTVRFIHSRPPAGSMFPRRLRLGLLANWDDFTRDVCICVCGGGGGALAYCFYCAGRKPNIYMLIIVCWSSKNNMQRSHCCGSAAGAGRHSPVFIHQCTSPEESNRWASCESFFSDEGFWIAKPCWCSAEAGSHIGIRPHSFRLKGTKDTKKT